MSPLESWFVFLGLTIGGTAVLVWGIETVRGIYEEWCWRRAVDAAELRGWFATPSGDITAPEAQETAEKAIPERMKAEG